MKDDRSESDERLMTVYNVRRQTGWQDIIYRHLSRILNRGRRVGWIASGRHGAR